MVGVGGARWLNGCGTLIGNLVVAGFPCRIDAQVCPFRGGQP